MNRSEPYLKHAHLRQFKYLGDNSHISNPVTGHRIIWFVDFECQKSKISKNELHKGIVPENITCLHAAHVVSFKPLELGGSNLKHNCNVNSIIEKISTKHPLTPLNLNCMYEVSGGLEIVYRLPQTAGGGADFVIFKATSLMK